MTDTQAPERIWVQPDLGLVGTGRWVTQGTENPFGNIPYIRADLSPSREQIEAMVKPLVWLEAGFDHDADLIDTTQTYVIQEGLFWYAAEINGVACGSNEAAKAAAQADHTSRILSALSFPEKEVG